MSARYTLQDFRDAYTEPCSLCHKLTTMGQYPERWMACDFHEGWMDGYNARETK